MRYHFYGYSIAALEDLCEKHRYGILKLEYNNAFLAPTEIGNGHFRNRFSLQEGYLNRQNRKRDLPQPRHGDSPFFKSARRNELSGEFYAREAGNYFLVADKSLLQVQTVRNSRTKMTENRRDDERISVNLPAKWDGLARNYEARIEDLSLGGCFVNTSGRVDVGEVVSVDIKLPSGEWLQLRGEVASFQPGIGFGLLFTFLTSDEEQALRELVSQ